MGTDVLFLKQPTDDSQHNTIQCILLSVALLLVTMIKANNEFTIYIAIAIESL